MSNHKHVWVSLYYRPIRPDLAIAFALKNLDRYVICGECKSVAMMDRSHSRMTELSPQMSEKRRADAETWNRSELKGYDPTQFNP